MDCSTSHSGMAIISCLEFKDCCCCKNMSADIKLFRCQEQTHVIFTPVPPSVMGKKVTGQVKTFKVREVSDIKLGQLMLWLSCWTDKKNLLNVID